MALRIATVSFRSLAPYSSSAVIVSPELEKESPRDYEERCWRERLNVNSAGQGIIPPMAFKKMLDSAAKRYPIKQRGASTFTKFFESGVLVLEPYPLSVTRETVSGERLFVPSDGIPGSGKRVWRNFPIIHEWSGAIAFHVLDDIIRAADFESTARQAFAFVGLGRFRPEHSGYYGRAELLKVKWS